MPASKLPLTRARTNTSPALVPALGGVALQIGAGGGAVAFWLAERVAPGGVVVATDVETDFLAAEAARYPNLEVLRHDITTEDLPTGFDLFTPAGWWNGFPTSARR